MKEKNIIYFYIRTLTPVHIGAAQEENMALGVDYLTNEGKLYFIDEKKILEPPHGSGPYRLDQYTNSLSKGDLKGLLKDNLNNFASSIVDTVVGEVGSDIKSHIRNTIDDKPYIPGTSLKGAIRSVIFNQTKNPNDKFEDWTFGKIQEDPFRYLIVGDAFFDQSEYINTKTFNLFKQNGEWYGGWKHRSTTNSKFDANGGFSFPYECIAPENYAQCRIVMNKKAYENAKNKSTVKQVDFFNKLADDQTLLFKTLKEYTANYINKEIAFFKKYNNQETDRIIAEYQRLLELNKKAPVLRIGQGSGFHSITGDWQFDTHEINGIFKKRGQYNKKNSAKSRKLAFIKENGEFRFYPMGFVQLLTSDEVNFEEIENQKKDRATKAEAERIKKEQDAAKAQKAAEEKVETQRRAAEEAKKPKMIAKSSLHNNKPKPVDAEVTNSSFGMVYYKVFIDEFKDKIFEFKYAAGMEIGTILTVQATLTKKGKLNIQGMPRKK